MTEHWNGLPPGLLGVPTWPATVDPARWRRAFGRPPRGVFVLYDRQVGERWGQLRALPWLRALGLTRFSFANGWRGLDVVPYDWQRVAADTTAEDLAGAFPLCQVVPQAMEDESDGDASHKLVRARDLAGPDALLVFVFDTPSFARRRGPSVRPFVDEYDLRQPTDYAVLARRAHAEAIGERPEALLTLNLAVQGLARFRQTPPQRPDDLLALDGHGPDSPVWDLYDHLCGLAAEGTDADRVRASLRPWVDRDLTRTLDRVLFALQGRDYDRAKLARLRAHRREAVA